mmetsp:Transcript_8106/g.20903  ORF Transcript_8106/g.20903 Transcript_8106/m.20903 type:complete len:620 (+) Transcript_8106:122-1981(+)
MGARCGREKGLPHDPSQVSHARSHLSGKASSAKSLCSSEGGVSNSESQPSKPRQADAMTRIRSEPPVNRRRTRRKSSISSLAFINSHPGLLSDYYDVGDKEGEGTQGVVFRAQRKLTGCLRAVKKVVKGSSFKEQEMLAAEINLMQRMDHPNIIKLYETFTDKRHMYIVMELCNGGELFDKIVAQGALTECEAAIVSQQILRAVHYMHGQDIVHRDLKPENFLFLDKGPIEDSNLLKIIDFGIAAACGENDTLTDMVGTPYYMAPQVLTRRYNRQCDLWSIGCILHVLLRGQVPFSGASDKEVMIKVRAGVLNMKDEDWRHVSEEGRDLVRKLLVRNAKERFTSEQALNHEWIKGHAPHAKPGALQIDLVGNLRNFRCKNRLKKMALALIANNMDLAQLKTLREAFTALDANGDGLLTLAEIKDGIEAGGLSVPDDLVDIINEADENGSGVIDYTEFLAATINKDSIGMISKEAAQMAFHYFDVDGDGKIDYAELHQVLGNSTRGDSAKGRSRAMSESLMRKYDTNGDGQIDFEEFQAMLHGSSGNLGKHLDDDTGDLGSPSVAAHAQEVVRMVKTVSMKADRMEQALSIEKKGRSCAEPISAEGIKVVVNGLAETADV